tara:strand:+ start:29 stop:538 length:510 start_codon:yes stop_codon:yes gene_type:complete
MDKFKQIVLILSSALTAVTGFYGGTVSADGRHSTISHSGPTTDYKAASSGTQNLVLGPVTIKMLLDASNLGRSDIEVGELTLPPEYGEGAPHPHGSLEIFYVVKGILGHEVNGRTYTLNPGDLGFVQPGDQVRHSVLSDSPVKAVVIWLPGGEAAALVEHAGFKREKIE